MESVGTHLIVDGWNASPDLLNDPRHLEKTLKEAIRIGGVTLIDQCLHQFSPHGITATATLAESHIAIHTWPEHGYFAADLFFCGRGDPYLASRVICKNLEAHNKSIREIKRGFELRQPAEPCLYEQT